MPTDCCTVFTPDAGTVCQRDPHPMEDAVADDTAMHLAEADLATLHDQNLTKDGSGTGSCLTAHAPTGRIIPEYNKDHSCSYRWQAHKISIDERKSIYDGIEIAPGEQGGHRQMLNASRGPHCCTTLAKSTSPRAFC